MQVYLLGAVLSQVQEAHSISYASRAFSPSKKKYGFTDLWTLAVVWALSNEDCLGVSVFSVDGNTSLDKLFQASSVVVCPKIIGRRSETKIKEIIDFGESELLPMDECKARKISLQASQFVISDTILYLLDTHRGYRKRAVVPEALQVELLQNSHGGHFSGHFSGQ